MATSPFSLLSLLVALSLLSSVDAFFILTHRPLIRTRLDSIVSPGEIAGHEHLIIGGSRFSPTYNYTDSLQAQCTTAEVSIDKSSYWAPQLYWRNVTGDGKFSAIDANMKTYYLQRPGSRNETIYAFPKGLTMLAGDPNRRTNNASNFEDQAVSFVCLDYYRNHQGDPAWAQRPDFFKQNCPDGLRAQINFPQCWDGVRLSSNDQSHMAYPIDNVAGGNCPATHPVHLVELFYEFIFNVGDWPFVAGETNWVFANGDTTGLGFHGDFINGWPTPGYPNGDVLQNALDTCGLETGGNVYECDAFAPFFDSESAAACQPELPVVDEPNGWKIPIAKLPGDNLIWSGTGPKPVDPTFASRPIPGYVGTRSTLPSGWTNLGCIAEGTNGRALSVSAFERSDLTLASCASLCQGAGLPYAGAEYSRQCFCGFELANGANGTILPSNQCNLHCSGLDTENCGGGNRLTLLYNPSLAPKAPTFPAGWAAESTCWTEAPSSRTLANASYASDSMTQSSCVSFCDSKGLSRAGIEYGRECYCGNDFLGGTAQATEGCTMPCSGASNQFCGGGNRLTTFRKSVPSSSRASSTAASSVRSTSSAASSARLSSSSSAVPSPSSSSRASSSSVPSSSSRASSTSSSSVSLSSSSKASSSASSSSISSSTRSSVSASSSAIPSSARSSAASSSASPSDLSRKSRRDRHRVIAARLALQLE